MKTPEGEEGSVIKCFNELLGFHPSIFRHMEKGLHDFMKSNTQNPTAEYYIPDIITKMISSGMLPSMLYQLMTTGLALLTKKINKWQWTL